MRSAQKDGWVGAWNEEACEGMLVDLLANDSMRWRMQQEDRAAATGTPAPALGGTGGAKMQGVQWVAIEGFTYLGRFFGLNGGMSSAQLRGAMREFCAKSYDDVVREGQHAADSFLPYRCFQSLWTITLWTHVLEIPLQLPVPLIDVPFGWSWGAFLQSQARL